MANAREEFLARCDKDDRAIYETLFVELESLAKELGDPEPANESAVQSPMGELPLRLRIAFEERVGASLRLEHRALRRPGALLWFFPSNGVARASTASRVSAMLPQLAEVGMNDVDVAAYAVDLAEAGFIDGGQRTLKNLSAGEPGGVDRTFRWPPHRVALMTAIRNVVARLNESAPLPAPAS